MALPPFGSSTPQATLTLPGKSRQVFFNIRDYGAVGDGVTDDLAAINAAIAAAMPTAGMVLFPPGVYAVSDTISISPAASASADTIVPSLVANAVGGRIGDISNETSQVMIVPAAGFTTGHLLVDYVSQGNAFSLNGAIVRGLDLKCGSVAGGMRISNPRRFRVQDVTIDHPATPVASNLFSASGGFNVCQQSGTATAYNYFSNIQVGNSAQDGFFHGAADNGTYVGCIDFDAARYGFNAQGMARYISCHYEGEQYGVNVNGGGQYNYFIGLDAFGFATKNAVRLTTNNSLIPVKFIGCYLGNVPGAAPGEENGAIISVIGSGQANIASFIGCTLRTSTNTTDLVYVESGVIAGSKVTFMGCDVVGPAVTNKLYNDASGHNVLEFIGCFGIPDTTSNFNRTAVADTAYTALMTDNYIAYTSLTAARTVTLPDATLYTGALTIKDEAGTAAAHNITLSPVSAQTIDGASSLVISSNFGVKKIYSNGANWFST